jgi:hypothetical protein
MPRFEKHFTVNEARACLPELRRRLMRINDLVAEIRKREEEQKSGITTIVRQNGKGPVVSGAGPQREEAQRLLDEIRDSGIQIKDLSVGLVDFPHFLNGDPENEVFLCWRFGEDTIEYWHGIENGFAGRRKLE